MLRTYLLGTACEGWENLGTLGDYKRTAKVVWLKEGTKREKLVLYVK